MEGQASLDRAMRMFEEILKGNPSYTDLSYVLGQTQIWKGEALAKAGNARGALDSYRKGLANLEVVSKGSPTPKSRSDVATALTKIGQALLKTGSGDEAATSFHKALESAEPLVAAKSPNILALYAAADAYSGLGDVASGRAAVPGAAAQETVRCKEAIAW